MMSVSTRLSENQEITAWVIDEIDPEEAFRKLDKLILFGNIVPSKYSYAEIKHDCSKGFCWDSKSEDHFVLRFGSLKGAPMIFVAPLSAGHLSDGSKNTILCIEKMGFNLTSDDKKQITSRPVIDGKRRDLVNLTFYKN